MPIHRRLPKRGFTNIFRKKTAIINIRDISKFESGTVVDEALLIKSGLIKGRRERIKLLSKGDIQNPLTIRLNAVSAGAQEKIKNAGGKIEVLQRL
jgi:large subunit ribosomal protein L15